MLPGREEDWYKARFGVVILLGQESYPMELWPERNQTSQNATRLART